MRTGLRFAGVLATLLPLAGCDKLKEHDQLVREMAERQKEIADLRAQVDASKLRISVLEALVLKSDPAPPPTPQPQVLSAEQVAAIKKVIAKCVQEVHRNAPADELKMQFYASFDAFYNLGTGRVENNVLYNGGRPALYAFNKCMTANGWPLS